MRSLAASLWRVAWVKDGQLPSEPEPCTLGWGTAGCNSALYTWMGRFGDCWVVQAKRMKGST